MIAKHLSFQMCCFKLCVDLNNMGWFILIKFLVPYDNKFWQKTKFGELANHYQTTKYKFRQYYFHIIIIIIISIYIAFLPLRRLLFGAPFPPCINYGIKSEHAAEIF